MKIYADEDIEDYVVDILRTIEGVNIIGAREVGLRGKPDSFQAAYAFKRERFLLARNGKISGTIEPCRCTGHTACS